MQSLEILARKEMVLMPILPIHIERVVPHLDDDDVYEIEEEDD